MTPALPTPGKPEEEPLTIPAGMHDGAADVPTAGRDRAGLAAEVELNPMSLAGSYFHRVENGEIVWDGLVVGEVQPGHYLCQVTSGLEGADRAKVQVIVGIDTMLAKDPGYEWRFYDTEEARMLAFAEFTVHAERSG